MSLILSELGSVMEFQLGLVIQGASVDCIGEVKELEMEDEEEIGEEAKENASVGSDDVDLFVEFSSRLIKGIRQVEVGSGVKVMKNKSVISLSSRQFFSAILNQFASLMVVKEKVTCW